MMIIKITIVMMIIIMSRPACCVPAFTENKHSKSFDLCSKIKTHIENNNDSDSVSSLRDQ